jgi:uncharacterized protein (TIGR03435 family)
MFVQGDISARQITLDQLAGRLTALVQRVVVNRTGIDGAFDVDIAWSPDLQSTAIAGAVGNRSSSLFAAVQEQLGLRLESHTSPVSILVIDGVVPPTPN